jgi:hypothetical protein
MKKTLLMSLMVLSMSLSATAIYDPNDTVTDPGERTPGDAKITALNGERISEYSLDLMQMDGRCGATGADNVSITPRTVSPGKNTLMGEGVFQTPHPRYNLTSQVEKKGEKQYVLRLKGVETSKVAPRCIGNVNYHAHFSAPVNSTLEVYHNQTKMEEEQISSGENTGKNTESPSEKEDRTDEKGFIRGIVRQFGEVF